VIAPGCKSSRRDEPERGYFRPAFSEIAPSVAHPLSVSVYAPLSRLCAMNPGLHRMGENADRGVGNAGRGKEQNHSVLCAEIRRPALP
jgi:hypothetical protein